MLIIEHGEKGKLIQGHSGCIAVTERRIVEMVFSCIAGEKETAPGMSDDLHKTSSKYSNHNYKERE